MPMNKRTSAYCELWTKKWWQESTNIRWNIVVWSIKRIEAATGESAEKIEKAYFKKLEKILKRGVIKDREEYELVHSRIDELVHNTPEDDPARKDLPELERIFMNYAIGE